MLAERSPMPRPHPPEPVAATEATSEATPPDFYDRPTLPDFDDVFPPSRPWEQRDTTNDARPISVSLLIELETFAKPSQIEHVLEEMLRAVKLGVSNRARAFAPDPEAGGRGNTNLDAAAQHLHAGHFANNGYWREIEVELS